MRLSLIGSLVFASSLTFGQITIGGNASILNSTGATITSDEGMVVNGTFSSGRGTLILGKDLTVQDTATFQPNKGTVQFEGGSLNTITETGSGLIRFNNLILDGSAGTTVASGTSARVKLKLTFGSNWDGTLTTNDGLRLQEQGTDTTALVDVQSSSIPVISGTVMLEAALENTNEGWRQIGFPFEETALSGIDFSNTIDLIDDGSNQNNIYTWNATDAGSSIATGWEVPTTIGPALGYTIYSNNANVGIHELASVLRAEGTLHLDPVSVNLLDTRDPAGVTGGINDGTEQGWNLIANPYPARLLMSDIASLLDSAGITYTAIHSWSQPSGQYLAHVHNGVSVVEYNLSNTADQGLTAIPVFGTFWIKTNGSKTLNFDMQLHTSADASGSDPGYFKVDPNQFQLNVFSPDSLWDGGLVYFDGSATNAFDPTLEGLKRFSTAANVPTLYFSEQALQTSIVARPVGRTIDTIPVFFQCDVTGTGFSLSLDEIKVESGTEIFMFDHHTQTAVNLSNTKNYGFDNYSTNRHHRFTLFVDRSSIGLTEGDLEEKPFVLERFRTDLFVHLREDLDNASGEILDLNGRVLQRINRLDAPRHVISTKDLPEGVYLFRLFQGDRVLGVEKF
ncbi:MAG: hypothetical protein HWE24_06585 [Oceanospirillaceae bacterium]|nr:hypothetical protein [Oceanospirillaceae bacterium]